MRKVAWLFLIALFGLAPPARAGDIHLDPSVTRGQLGSLAAVVADALEMPCLAPSEPFGLTGFQVLVAAGGPQVDTGEGWWQGTVSGSTTGGALVAPRLLVRKGLPLKVDVGVQVGDLLGYRFWGGDVRWALLEGGTISPAVGVRVSYSQLRGAPLSLSSVQAQVGLSKGFAFLTPYVAVGYRDARGSARIGDPALVADVTDSRVAGAAGVRVSLVPLQLVAEVRQARERAFFVGVGVGL